MIPASDRLYRAIVEARLILLDHEELRQHAANAIARHSRRGWRLDKAGRTGASALPALQLSSRHRLTHARRPRSL